MRTRSTWIAAGLFLTAGTALTAIACSPDATAPDTRDVQVPAALSPAGLSPAAARKADRTRQAWMGKYHNDALGFALTKVKAGKKQSRRDRCKAGIAALKDYQRAFMRSAGTAAFTDVSVVDGMCEAAESRSLVSNSLGIDPTNARPSSGISAQADSYLNQILAAVDNNSSLPGLNSAVNSIANSASYSLSSAEAAAVSGTASIAQNSAAYWDGNGGSLGGPKIQYNRASEPAPVASAGIAPPGAPSYSMSARGKRIVRADVAAAIGVLVSEWFLGEAALGKACVKAAAASLIAAIYLT